MPPLAINTTTGAFTFAAFASKSQHYKCPECSERVTFRNGDVRGAHFAHLPESKCAYSGGEGETHKTAKHLLAHILTIKEPVEFRCKCSQCNRLYDIVDIHHRLDDDVTQELVLPNGNRADVAVAGKDGLRYVIEVCDTHKTESTRPEPWFEVNAVDVIKAYNEKLDYAFRCVRTDRTCKNCTARDDKENRDRARGCSGRGECLLNTQTNNRCPHACTPITCPDCNDLLPQWVADCNRGTCINCAMRR